MAGHLVIIAVLLSPSKTIHSHFALLWSPRGAKHTSIWTHVCILDRSLMLHSGSQLTMLSRPKEGPWLYWKEWNQASLTWSFPFLASFSSPVQEGQTNLLGWSSAGRRSWKSSSTGFQSAWLTGKYFHLPIRAYVHLGTTTSFCSFSFTPAFDYCLLSGGNDIFLVRLFYSSPWPESTPHTFGREETPLPFITRKIEFTLASAHMMFNPQKADMSYSQCQPA